MSRLPPRVICIFLSFIFLVSVVSTPVFCGWGNGGDSDDPFQPRYGTHDWIAEHAKNWLPTVEREWIDDNLNFFLYGTEYPDNSGASYGTTRGYGDAKNYNYYDNSGSVTDASAANRAKAEYDKALTELKAGRNITAAIYAGSMTHYIVDVAVFGHVLIGGTHREDYVYYVETRTASYSYGVFESYLVFDGVLENVSAYDASISLGRNTFNDDGGTYTASWMDTNYDWSNPAFKNRCGESLNLATNYVADVLHSLYVEAVTKSSSSTLISISTASVTIGSSVSISGSISPAHASVTVTLSFSKPDRTTLTRTATTASDGSYSYTFTPDAIGSWNVKASWPGDADHYGSESASKSFAVSKASSTISCSISSATITISSSVSIAGAINLTHTATVTIEYRPSGGLWSTLATETSGSDGRYSYTWTPASVGSYEVRASWLGDDNHIGATSSVVSITINKASSTISCTISPSPFSIGETANIIGSISPPVEGVKVVVEHRPVGGTWTTLTTVTTKADGSYSYSWTPEKAGEYEIRSSWLGDLDNEGATSPLQTVMVEKRCIIATTAYGSELNPSVQFLREFRESKVLPTFAGSQFMKVFNAWYYSFSPSVAGFIDHNPLLKTVMKGVLYPLIGILNLSTTTYNTFSFNNEVGAVMAGMVASTLIGIVYFLPLTIIPLAIIKKYRKTLPKAIQLFLPLLIPWLVSVYLIFMGEIAVSPILMMVATGTFVTLTIALVAGTLALKITHRFPK